MAWTDALQGSLLLVGCVVVFIAVLVSYGGLEPSSAKLAVLNPEFFVAPNAQGKLRWASTLLLVGAGVSIYPHAIQRIYAARDARTLRRSLQWMLLMPFATSLLVLTIGLIGAAQFPGLDRKGSEEIVLIVMQELARSQPALQAVVVMLVCAIVAAIMSTIDSAMLAISSLLTRDFYAILRPEANQSTLTRFGRRISWLLMAALAALAITLPQTLWRITEIKLELLCQVAPAIYLGLHGTALRARPVLAGLVTGLLITVLLDTSEWLPGPSLARPLGIHAGIWGLAANLLVTVAMQSAGARKAPGRAELSAG